jgi:hypothetical protein
MLMLNSRDTQPHLSGTDDGRALDRLDGGHSVIRTGLWVVEAEAVVMYVDAFWRERKVDAASMQRCSYTIVQQCRTRHGQDPVIDTRRITGSRPPG